MVICLEQGADCLHTVLLMPVNPKTPSFLPCLNPDWFYLSGTGFLVPGCPGKEAVKWLQ